jgi:uncharacterized protein YecE (DUF72 family)
MPEGDTVKAWVGCSGYHYSHWKGNFYPVELKKKEWLGWYAERFNTVEINKTFYSLPKRETLIQWRDETPGGFLFTFKGSRYVTHMKKLQDAGEHVPKLYRALEPMGEKAGCVLWQLPGNLHKDLDRLEAFCRSLSRQYRNVIEFRHASWFDRDVEDILRNHGIAFCALSAPDDLPEDVRSTADFLYLRFHGKDDWYRERYTREELGEWHERLVKQGGKECFVYFNNDYKAYAPENAETMKELFS